MSFHRSDDQRRTRHTRGRACARPRSRGAVGATSGAEGGEGAVGARDALGVVENGRPGTAQERTVEARPAADEVGVRSLIGTQRTGRGALQRVGPNGTGGAEQSCRTGEGADDAWIADTGHPHARTRRARQAGGAVGSEAHVTGERA